MPSLIYLNGRPGPARKAVSSHADEGARQWRTSAGAHVRFVRPAATWPPHATAATGSLAAPVHPPVHFPGRSAEPGADGTRVRFHAHAAAHHARTPGHDPHLLEKQMFAKVVAGQLNAAADRRDFDGLILVAPLRTLKTICDALNAATRAQVVATLENDSVTMLDRDLLLYIQTWMDGAERRTTDADGGIPTQGGNTPGYVE
jgi:Protein required for attachment to host cells